MVKNSYHLATFNKPLTDQFKIPSHVIERPINQEEQDRLDIGRQFGTVQNMVYRNNNNNYEQAS